MRSFISSLLFILLICTCACADSSVWKVQKNQYTMYLGGTFHLLRDSDFPLPPEFQKAYNAADSVVFEANIGKLKHPSIQQKLLAEGMYTDGSTLDMHLSPQAYAALSAHCASAKIPLDSLRTFKPSLVVITLSVVEFMKLGVTQQGVDVFFYEQALKDNKTVEGLESVDDQIRYVMSMADGNENDFIIHSIKDMKNVKQKFEGLVEAWRAGNTDQMHKLILADMQDQQSGLYKKLIVERNNNWLPILESYQNKPGTRFVLVGVAHLVGPDGLIETLRRKGYTVEKL